MTKTELGNDKNKIRVKFHGSDCEWMLFASSIKKKSSELQVNRYKNVHSYGRVLKLKTLRTKWLAKKYIKETRADPKMKISAIK